MSVHSSSLATLVAAADKMLYNYTARALLRADPLIAVGGPATARLGHVADFLNFTGNGSAVPAAFVSTHSYPTDYRNLNASLLTRTLYEDNIWAAAALATDAGLPFLMTEISSGLVVSRLLLGASWER